MNKNCVVVYSYHREFLKLAELFFKLSGFWIQKTMDPNGMNALIEESHAGLLVVDLDDSTRIDFDPLRVVRAHYPDLMIFGVTSTIITLAEFDELENLTDAQFRKPFLIPDLVNAYERRCASNTAGEKVAG